MTQTTNAPTGSPKGGGKKFLIIALVIIGVILLICCGGVTTCALLARSAAKSAVNSMGLPTVTEGPGGTVTVEGKGVSITSGGAGKLPDNFPSDVAVYSGMKQVASFADRTSGGGTVSFTAKAGISKEVAKFYHDKMTSAGWTEDSNMQMNEMTMMSYSQDKRVAAVTVTEGTDATTVQIIYGKK